jgi:hypothetical protein
MKSQIVTIGTKKQGIIGAKHEKGCERADLKVRTVDAVADLVEQLHLLTGVQGYREWSQ